MSSGILAGLRARLLNNSSLSQESVRDGQTFLQSFFQNTIVDNVPAFLLDNNFVRLLNFGQITTNNAPAAVQVNGEDADIFNFRSGSIEANGELATAINVAGSADIRNFGEIAGEFNGVAFTGPESSGTLTNFRGGTISSDSRAVDIQGDGVEVRNFGDIVGTGDQRNGTIYTNSTADNFSISNFAGGTIDAGENNEGAGVSLQVGDVAGETVSGDIFNAFGATIQGRGQAAANTPGAGDGIRVNNGAEGTVFSSDIINSGLVTSESNQGTAGGIRVADGVGFEGQILNTSTGVIEGVRNGLYIGEAEHDLDVRNFGTISSDSRAVNIDGTGVDLLNGGDILGTGDQRNGTVYAAGTATDFSITNLVNGTIDAGFENQGSGVGVAIGSGPNSFELNNAGLIQGRGNAGAATNLAGDGVRIGNVGNVGTTDATITNSGTISSEGANGTVAGIRFVNGVSFQGEFVNEEGGLVEGVQNGVYFGTGDHTGGTFTNRGTVTSDSRALNIDGNGLEVVNEGEILGTGDQRNGTVYADGTADNYILTNTETGLIDAGLGNNGSGVSLQTGDVDGDIVSGSVFNEGTIQGRGDAAEGNTIGDGLRVFSNFEDASLAGVIQNEGLIAGSEDSAAAAGIRVDGGVDLLGAIINEGEIRGFVNAIDATEGGSVTLVNDDDGVINGNVLLGDEEDILVDLGEINGVIDGGAGDDVLIAGDADNVIIGGVGNDFIDGGEGFDTVDFSDLDVPVNVVLDENGNGTATRETGFSVRVENVVVGAPVQGPPATQIADAGDFVEQAVAGNLYYNIHTSDFIGGEIRGQLTVVEGGDVSNGHIRTITLAGELDASQEPGPSSDSDATGTATVVITQNLETGLVTYSSDLTVEGLAESDLQTPIPGAVSAIHLHNAPAGQNGGVVQDTLVDAGATIDGNVPSGVTGLDVIDNAVEVDTLFSIENVIGSDDADVIVTGAGDNVLTGGIGNDLLDGGEGEDTADFSDLDVDIQVDLDADGNGTVTRETGFSVRVQNVAVDGALQGPPATQVADADDFIDEALAGNLYYNIHTEDFPAGEIRGQLFVVEGGDVTNGDVRTISLTGNLDASQEPGPTSDSEATGTASLTITQNLLTGEVSYSSLLSVTGLEEADLLTPNAGAVSAIHLHNAPAGQNGGIVQDTLVDAGATLDPNAPSGVSGLDVIDEVIETDTLVSIENIIDGEGNLIEVDGDAFVFGEVDAEPEAFVENDFVDPDFPGDEAPEAAPYAPAPEAGEGYYAPVQEAEDFGRL